MSRILAYDEQVLTDTGVGKAIDDADEALDRANSAQKSNDALNEAVIGATVYTDGTHADVFYDDETDTYYYLDGSGEQVAVDKTALKREYTDSSGETYDVSYDSGGYYYTADGTKTYVAEADTSLVIHYVNGALDDISASLTELSGDLSVLTGNVTTISSEVESASAQISAVESRQDATEETLSGIMPEITNMKKMIVLDPDGEIIPDHPSITVLAGDNRVQITDQKISFILGDNEVAYIDQNKLYIKESEMTNVQKIGPFVWEVRGANRVSLKYAPQGGN